MAKKKPKKFLKIQIFKTIEYDEVYTPVTSGEIKEVELKEGKPGETIKVKYNVFLFSLKPDEYKVIEEL